MSVWIVHEFAEIERLIEQAETRAMALGMKLAGIAQGIETNARPSARVPDSVKIDTERYTASAGDAMDVHDTLGPARTRAARAVKRAAELIPENPE